jgi:hypothetical protein
MHKKHEMLFWSIALPGFAQFLNRAYLKGITLIAMEFIVNVQSQLNLAIIYSFQGDTLRAVEVTNYQWLMFYPCTYLFAIWDAYRDAGGGKGGYSFLPSVTSAYFGTIGVIYSSTFRLYDFLLGPIFLPILSLIFGAIFGWLLMHLFRRFTPA